MTKDEALQMCLEYIETDAHERKYVRHAIKAALEAKDEPVAQPEVRTGNCLRVGVCASEGHKIQPQRTWVSLTDEEKAQFVVAYYPSNWDRKTAVSLMNDYEKYLKEKNT